MVKKAKSTKVKRVAMQARRPRPARPIGDSSEEALLKLIMDPCQAPLAHGYGLGTQGIVQRFSTYLPIPLNSQSSPTDDISVLFTPAGGAGGVTITQYGYNGVTYTYQNSSFGNPHNTFASANADSVSVLGACVELVYTGKLVDRRGVVGVCQAKNVALNDVFFGSTPATPDQRLTYCQAMNAIGQHPVDAKWLPTQANLTTCNFAEDSTSYANLDRDTNSIMLALKGVDRANLLLRFTTVIEYVPKATLGQPAARPSVHVPPGAPQRLASKLDSYGSWWHSLDHTLHAAGRLAGNAFKAVGTARRLTSAVTQAGQFLLAAA